MIIHRKLFESASRPKAAWTTSRAFTLMEILAALVVVAVLGFLLIAGVQKAREISFSASCIANQRAIYTAILGYARDNQNNLPPAMVGTTAYWQGSISPYTDSQKIFVCKGHPAIAPKTLNYGYNMAFGNVNTDMERKEAYQLSGGNRYGIHRLHRFTKPSQTTMLMDLAHVPGTPNFNSGKGHVFYYDGSYSIKPESFVHNGGMNILWVDGHISRVTPEDMKTWSVAEWTAIGNYE